MTEAPAWPAGYARKEFDTLDSTNEEARRMAAAGADTPVWITARHQSAGRGRRGRDWQSPHGNLAATLLLRPDRGPAECAQLSFVAALAAAETVARLAPAAGIGLKWPNDVLVEGKKIAGILLEAASGAGVVPVWLAVGIGINLAHHPQDTEFPATSIAALGASAPPPAEALAHLATAFAKWYDVWRAEGFAPVREAWLARAVRLGEAIRARLGQEEATGVFEGIDETGALILRQAGDRVRAISAGDVFFGA